MQPTDSNKKTRLIIQDFNKLSLLKHDYPPLSREISLQPKTTHKRSILSNLKSQRKTEKANQLYDSRMVISKGLSNWAQSPEKTQPNNKILFHPQQSFQSNSSKDFVQNPEQKIQAHSSMKLNRGTFHRLEKNISQRYQRKIEVLKQLRIPQISHQLFTISHFTQEALNSIPKHVEIFNEKLKLLKKSMTPIVEFSQRKHDVNQMPLQLKTLRVIRKSSADKNLLQLTRKSHHKFRMYLTKKSKKIQPKPQIYKIQGWKQQKTANQRTIYE